MGVKVETEKLIEMLEEAKYTPKWGGFKDDMPIINEDKMAKIKQLVEDWATIEEARLAKQFGELSAKCFIYEAVISNSNFAPVIINPEQEATK